MFGRCAVPKKRLQFSSCACLPCAGAMLIFSVSFKFSRMIPEGNPHAKTAGKSGRSQKFKEALTPRFWQPLLCKHLLPCIWWFGIPPLRLGVGGGVEPMRESQSSGPSEPRVGLDCRLFLLSLILPLPHLHRRLSVCACVHLDTFCIYLSHFYLSISFISLVSLCVSPRMSLNKKQRPVQS
jgi:hypothetical protein